MNEPRGSSGLAVFGIITALLVCGGAVLFATYRRADQERMDAAMQAERREQAAAMAAKGRLPPPAPVAVDDAGAERLALEHENAQLKAEVDRLKAELAAGRSAAPVEADPGTPKKFRTKEELAESFRKVAKGGAFSMGSKEFMALAEELKSMGPEGLALLSEWLGSGKSSERFIAAALMEGIPDAAHVPALIQALKDDSDDLVRRMASHALAVGKYEGSLDPLLNAMAGDKDWGVRVNSAYGVAKTGDPRGVEALVKAYEDPDSSQYKLAILGGLSDVADPSTAPVFREILAKQKDMTALLMSISAVEKMKDKESLDSLKDLMFNSKIGTVRDAAKKAYNEISGSEVYK